MTNLAQQFQAVAHARADAIAFVGVTDEEAMTYSELEQQVSQLAAMLASRGVRAGDRVVVQLPKTLAVVVLYLAVLRIGAVYVPLNTDYTAAELKYFIDDCEPSLIFLPSDKPAARGSLSRGMPLADLAEMQSQALQTEQGFQPVLREANDLAAIVYTSGTTGRSKGAMLSHANLLSNARTLIAVWGFSAEDTLLHALPLYHVHGLFVALHCALLSGCCTRFLNRFEISSVLQELNSCSVMMGVPTFYGRMLDAPDFPPPGMNMRLFISGSAPLLADTFQAFKQRTGHRILERYGMTEAGMICSNTLQGERIPGTVGPPLPAVQVRIRTAEGALAGSQTPGMLEICGPNVFQGYWRNPGKTAENFTDDGFFITGDLAEMDAQGRISIVGRQKDLIISGGLNVYPREVEMAIDEYPGVLESAVIGVPHGDFGEAVVAILVADLDASTEELLNRHLRQSLAGYKVPKATYFLESLPRNSMGKVQKNLLRERYSETFS